MPDNLIGAAAAVTAIVAELRRPEVRWLTITGPAGLGKTRLALATARNLCDAAAFPDGVFYVRLAPLTDVALFAPQIAHALRFAENDSRPLIESLSDYLRPRRILLVLDNFERLPEAAPQATALLAAAPQVKLLVVSRHALQIAGEHEFAARPLTLPAATMPATFDRVGDYDAVRLFVERARAVRFDFELGADNARLIAEICVRLGGLPLAIELAAAQVNYMPLPNILALLDQNLTHLAAATPTTLPLQLILRGSLDLSYRLLVPAEQTIFRRLAVFGGSFTPDAAATVCAVAAEIPPETHQHWSVLDMLTRLLNHNLLQADAGEGSLRFDMLPAVREYALEKLEAAGEVETIRQRHAAHYLALAEEAEAHISGTQPSAWLDRLERDYDNFRVALAWGLAQQDAETVLRLGGALGKFWEITGRLNEGCHWLECALAATAATRQSLKSARVKALAWSARFACRQGAVERAQLLSAEALALARNLEDRNSAERLVKELGRCAPDDTSA